MIACSSFGSSLNSEKIVAGIVKQTGAEHPRRSDPLEADFWLLIGIVSPEGEAPWDIQVRMLCR